jgi:hypothetical protein
MGINYLPFHLAAMLKLEVVILAGLLFHKMPQRSRIQARTHFCCLEASGDAHVCIVCACACVRARVCMCWQDCLK